MFYVGLLISNINIITGYDFICFYADEGDNAFIMNNKGQDIKKVPYGNNYFKYVGGGNNWLLEDKNRESVLDASFPIDHIRDNYYSFFKMASLMYLTKKDRQPVLTAFRILLSLDFRQERCHWMT